MQLVIAKQNRPLFLRGEGEHSGVAKIAAKVRKDIDLVTGFEPAETVAAAGLGRYAVIYGTDGASEAIADLAGRGVVDLSSIRGKRETYLFRLVERPAPGVECALVIAGSDKRGTIYGLFHLSEVLGVSPLVNWSAVVPPRTERVELSEDDNVVSKEPSVRYRGFFINDEWPAFGTWANTRFGGVNADLYEHVFELLLRLKGNYLWPAMWASVFSEEGPGLASAELADEYGVVMGMSHHEPCLRHGEEYKRLRGKDSIYGDAWNFRTNRDGIIRFWEDGLKRSGRFENVITVGMRGEQDSKILGRDATLKDNIDLLRDVLKTQNELIREHVDPDLTKVPRMLALYKEVESYYYGDEETPGLIGSEELEDVILMLSDDNFGNLRTLPTEEMRDHPGGYGIYYHFDYHGWPVSYEWINSTYLPKVWEQMTTAYEFGIRDLWIVNVGDIATEEFPLSFFLDLAYDFEKWGADVTGSAQAYTRSWVDRQFDGHLAAGDRELVAEILTEYTRIAHMRRPEAMNADVYHPANYREGDRMLARVDTVIKQTEALRKRVPPEIADAFHELVYYPAVGTMNLYRMQLTAGKDMFCARHGRVEANALAREISTCIARDREIVDEFHTIANGRWYGMGLSEHVGFTQWNEEECAYPLQVTFEPANKPRIVVSVAGTSAHTQGGDWTGRRLELTDFRRPDVTDAEIIVACGSAEPAPYEVACDKPWLSLSATTGTVSETDTITVTIDRAAQGGETDAVILVTSGAGRVAIDVPAAPIAPPSEPMIFVETNGYVAIEAEHSYAQADVGDAGFRLLPGHGRTRSAMKVFPVTASFEPGGEAPHLEYRFIPAESGPHEVTLYLSPSNPTDATARIRYSIQANGGEIHTFNSVGEGHQVGDEQASWAQGVLDNIRKHRSTVDCVEGVNSLRISAVDPGFVLERIVVSPAGHRPPESYLGPPESFFVER
ncbi:MAG: glycosyl hydrolase 115 family protein [Spirochaetota bacterium]